MEVVFLIYLCLTRPLIVYKITPDLSRRHLLTNHYNLKREWLSLRGIKRFLNPNGVTREEWLVARARFLSLQGEAHQAATPRSGFRAHGQIALSAD